MFWVANDVEMLIEERSKTVQKIRVQDGSSSSKSEV